FLLLGTDGTDRTSRTVLGVRRSRPRAARRRNLAASKALQDLVSESRGRREVDVVVVDGDRVRTHLATVLDVPPWIVDQLHRICGELHQPLRETVSTGTVTRGVPEPDVDSSGGRTTVAQPTPVVGTRVVRTVR